MQDATLNKPWKAFQKSIYHKRILWRAACAGIVSCGCSRGRPAGLRAFVSINYLREGREGGQGMAVRTQQLHAQIARVNMSGCNQEDVGGSVTKQA